MTNLDQYTYHSSYRDGKYRCYSDEFYPSGSGDSFQEAFENCKDNIQKEIDSGTHPVLPKVEQEQWQSTREFMPYVESDDVSDLCNIDVMRNFTPEQNARWDTHRIEQYEHEYKTLKAIATKFRELADHIESRSYPAIMSVKIPKNSIGKNGVLESWGIRLSHPWGG